MQFNKTSLNALSLIIVLMVVGLGTASGANEVIEVRHRLPGEVAALVRPLLEPGEVVVPVPSGLLVKASAGRLEEIRKLVKTLDRRLRQMTITVVQSDVLTLDELNAKANLSLHLPSERPIHGRAHVYRSQSDKAGGSRQRLKTLEGQAAYILIGEERPVPVIGLYGYPPVAIGGIDYKPVTRGFKVIPRMVGCRVRLSIAPWSRKMSHLGGGRVDVQAAESTLEVEPGQWIELGATSGDLDETREPLFGYDYTTERRHSRIFVRVDVDRGCH